MLLYMPYKSKCFSKCSSLSSRSCNKNKTCRKVKGYKRSGYKNTKSHCRLSSKYVMSRKLRNKGCSVRRKM